LGATDSHDDVKRVEAITRAEDVPVLDKEASTGVERISSHFTIAAAAAGLISDERESYRSVQNARLD
jgi:hypothetical protein